ncbi:DUF349 domain-containing protein [Undibacterium sp. Jales W-56]|uniref:DUF349 domain-containing protein n=1 Tax=Undibacterium sp. Jales W-56 TaxID=2897325 RepID=UPI0021D08F45|nr:DUF349 domain-containing protein [Undibacterium sp. Jales W-56]MCU6435732.1 DUF349 domain-containing protein [Undibacterium sp. Jales W-56]
MFDFLFKRRPKFTAPSLAHMTSSADEEKKESQRQENAEKNAEKRVEVLARIQTLTQDENALVEIVLSCDFADGRYSAAQHLHSADALQKVANALRNTDKRVAKLMQSRLDDLAALDRQRQLAMRCLEQAQQLARDEKLMPQQLIELDKMSAKAGSFPDDLKQEFDQVCQRLQARIASQTSLQRKIIDLSYLLTASMGIADSSHQIQLDQWQHEFEKFLSEPEAASLPKNLLSDFTEKMQAVRQQWEWLQQQNQRQTQQLSQQLSQQESSTKTDSANPDDVVVHVELFSEAEHNVDCDSDQLVSKIAEIGQQEKSSTANNKPVARIVSTGQIIQAIDAMELALEQGSALQAQKIERDTLRGVDLKRSGLSTEQKERLFKVQSELGRLLSWAKWGGSISRDELIKAAENLPRQELEPNDLAKKIGGLRERWKSLEASSGGASKEVWDKFDAACNLAYAPAAAHFQQLAQLRSENLEKAEILLQDWRSKADVLLNATDWKSVAQFLNEMKQAWRESGNVDRKHKQGLDAAFNALYQSLSQPLELQRKNEVALRAQFIQQAMAIDPARREAVDQLRQLQTRWQERALALPLRRKDEQQLWEKFRAACDALFMQRKTVIGQIDEERKANLAAKLAVCTRIEQAVASTGLQDESGLQKLLREVTQSWREIGVVSRNDEAMIEKKFQAACLQLKRQIEQAKESDIQAGKKQLQSKFDLCQKAERLLLDGFAQAKLALPVLSAEWDDLTRQKVIFTSLDQIFNKRFAAWVQALEAHDKDYQHNLFSNAELAGSIILQLEILNGVDSPAELARTRLQMQVEVLQETLKSGSQYSASLEQLQRFYATPAVLSPPQQLRVAHLLTVSQI